MSQYDPQVLREELDMFARTAAARANYSPTSHMELLTRATIGLIDGQKSLAATVDRKFVAVDARFDRLETKVDNLETRFDNLENRFDNLETRFDNLETRYDGLEARYDGLEAKVDHGFARMEREMGLMSDSLRVVLARTERLVGYIERKERPTN